MNETQIQEQALAHRHVWALNGCHCGAHQCAYFETVPRARRMRGDKEFQRCSREAVSSNGHCATHTGCPTKALPPLKRGKLPWANIIHFK